VSALVVSALAVLFACSRPQPSPDYDRARQLWTALVQARSDAAAEDPRADEVLALLDRVPRDSVDAPAAAELRGSIDGERKARAEERARRQALVAGAGALPRAPAEPPPPAAGAQPESQPPPPTRLAVGTKLEAFRESHGDCFESRGPVQLNAADGGGPSAAEMWLMKDDAACREKHAQLTGQAVVFAKGALLGVAPAASVKRVEVVRQIELATLPDGGPAERVDGGVVALPPGAELVLDGGTAGGGGAGDAAVPPGSAR
jgi:hypothetical protein